MLFYLGTDNPAWLDRLEIPLFVSHRRLMKRRTHKPATTRWALDSGGFTELSMYGQWTTSTSDYINAVRTYRDEIGRLDWAAPQDAMCEPWILERSKRWLGGTVTAHQQWTVTNFLQLRHDASDLPFMPVIQGWQHDDYLRHIDMYDKAGITLVDYPTVGIGSVCRRQATDDIAELIATLAGYGLNMHGFGVKTSGIGRYGWMLTSADSMAWSLNGRHIKPCPVRPVGSCAHCVHHALEWRLNVLEKLETSSGVQLALG